MTDEMENKSESAEAKNIGNEQLAKIYVKQCRFCGTYSLSQTSNIKTCGKCFKKLPRKVEFIIPGSNYEEVIDKLLPAEAIIADVDEKELEKAYDKLNVKQKNKLLEKEKFFLKKYAASLNINSTIHQKSRNIIHGAAALSGTIGAVPIPIADAIPLSVVQTSMMVSICHLYGETDVKKTTFAGMIAALAATQAGRQIVKLIPVANVAVGAATAVALTEAMGWYLLVNLEKGKRVEKIVKDFKPSDVLDIVKLLRKVK